VVLTPELCPVRRALLSGQRARKAGKMFAINTIKGASNFRVFRGTKQQCENWLEEVKTETQNEYQGTWINRWSPKILNDRDGYRAGFHEYFCLGKEGWGEAKE
jgi:hypothetical protein